MTFNEWMRKRWYVFAILVGVGSAISQLFISNRHPITIGFLIAIGVSYLIYRMQNSDISENTQNTQSIDDVDESVDSLE